jgi:hypothetical protein
MKMNLDDMTIGEMVLFEDTAGIPVGKLSENIDSMSTIRALVLIQLRRDNPEATLADVDAIKMSELAEASAPDEEAEPDPTEEPG